MLIYQRVNTMISWFHDYHTMVFIHIHKFIDLYSMTHVIIHIIYIYIYIYIHIICKLSQSWTNAVYFLLHQNPEFGQIRISYDLLTGGLCIHVISCNVNTVYNPQKQSLSQCPGHIHSGGEHRRSLKIQMAPTYTRSIDFSQQMMFPLGIRSSTRVIRWFVSGNRPSNIGSCPTPAAFSSSSQMYQPPSV